MCGDLRRSEVVEGTELPDALPQAVSAVGGMERAVEARGQEDAPVRQAPDLKQNLNHELADLGQRIKLSSAEQSWPGVIFKRNWVS